MGLLICPNEPVSVIFIFALFVSAKLRDTKEIGVAKSTFVVVEMKSDAVV